MSQKLTGPENSFSNLPLPQHFQNLLLDMKTTCCLIVDFVSGDVAPPAQKIAMHRNLTQYRLLKLQAQEDVLVETCRTTALLFSFCIIFPRPDWSHKRFLAGMLELKIRKTRLLQTMGLANTHREEKESWGKRKTELEFLLWTAMIGALTGAMTMSSEATSFVSLLARMADTLRAKAAA